MLYQDICQKEQITPYIPLYQIRQDHLEIFFGCIRAIGRQNNNPTVRQFQAAFKRLLLRTEIKGAVTGNCISFDDISILSATSALKPEELINKTCMANHMIDNYEIDTKKYINQISIEHDHPYIVALTYNTINLTQYSVEVISYIAGFIVRHIIKSIMCDTCVDSLIDNSKSGKIIQIKDRGSLIYPTASVIKICLETEKVIRLAMKESDIISNSKYSVCYITQKVLSNLNMINIFEELLTHSND